MSVSQGILMSALAVAMQAKCGAVDALDLGDLVTRAHQMLDPDDPVFRAITNFATQCETSPSAEQLAQLGNDLSDRIDAATAPTPPNLDRKDIYG